MDARELEALAKRLGQDANDTEALNAAYAHGQADPRGYAVFLEKAGQLSSDPAMGAHWYNEAATVWTASLNDAGRALRALRKSVDMEPVLPTAAERLHELFREKGDVKGVATLEEHRAKSIEKQLAKRPELAPHLGAIYAGLGVLYQEELEDSAKALGAYEKAASNNEADAVSIYQARELLKAQGNIEKALPYYEAEQRLIEGDDERKKALYLDEASQWEQLGDSVGRLAALRNARSFDLSEDPALKQMIASAVLEKVQAGEEVSSEDRTEALDLFLSLAETYDGEYGHSYSICALELEAGNDRAAQLVMYYGEQAEKLSESIYPLAAYLGANPQGAVSMDARRHVMEAVAAGAEESLLEQLLPREEASTEDKVFSYCELGRTFADQSNEERALEFFKQVLGLEPAQEEAIAFVTESLRASGSHEELAISLVKAATVDTGSLTERQAWLDEAAQLFESELEDLDGAIEARRQMVLMDPSDEAAADHLESTLEHAEKWEELAELLVRRAEIDVDSFTKLEREKRVAGLYRDQLEQPLKAAEALARIALSEPDDVENTSEALKLFAEANAAAKAIELLTQLLNEMLGDELRAEYSERLALLLDEAKDFSTAGGAFAEAASVKSDAALWAKARQSFEQAQAWEQAAGAVAEERALVDELEGQASLLKLEAIYREKLGDTESVLSCLSSAAELTPMDRDVYDALYARYTELQRFVELSELILRKAEHTESAEGRVTLRKEAAKVQAELLKDEEGVRQIMLLVLEDGEDQEALEYLVSNAEQSGDQVEAIEYLKRLVEILDETKVAEVAYKLGSLLLRDGESDAALLEFERVLAHDENHLEARKATAAQELAGGNQDAAIMHFRKLDALIVGDAQLEVRRQLADLYEETEQHDQAALVFAQLFEADSEDLHAAEKLRDLALNNDDYEAFVKYQTILLEVEGDEGEASEMAISLADAFENKLNLPQKALKILEDFAQIGDEVCRENYIRLGDKLGLKGQVATHLVAWLAEAPAGPKRNSGLRSAYQRFEEVGDRDNALKVGLELIHMKGADNDLAQSLEKLAQEAKNIDALTAAYSFLGSDLSGPPRAEEMVRQAEQLAKIGMNAADVTQHGEQALTSISPEQAEPLLARLVELSRDPAAKLAIYERQVTRCKSPDDRRSALYRAAEIALAQKLLAKAKAFIELTIPQAGRDEHLGEVRSFAVNVDQRLSGHKCRDLLIDILKNAGQGSRDGGRTRSASLAKAAEIAHEDLNNTSSALQLYQEALITHVEEVTLQALVALGRKEKVLKGVLGVIGKVLERVHDGPLVRMILRQRYQLLVDDLNDAGRAAEDLRKLYDLSPGDVDIAEKLENFYESSKNHRGLVKLYEDRILRGRDQSERAVLAEKVAHIWQDILKDNRESADAWRRVLRMKPADETAKAALKEAKRKMREESAANAEAEATEAEAVSQDIPDSLAEKVAVPPVNSNVAAPTEQAATSKGDTGTSDAQPELAKNQAENKDIAESEDQKAKQKKAETEALIAEAKAKADAQDQEDQKAKQKKAETEALIAETKAKADAQDQEDQKAKQKKAETEALIAEAKAKADAQDQEDQKAKQKKAETEALIAEAKAKADAQDQEDQKAKQKKAETEALIAEAKAKADAQDKKEIASKRPSQMPPPPSLGSMSAPPPSGGKRPPLPPPSKMAPPPPTGSGRPIPPPPAASGKRPPLPPPGMGAAPARRGAPPPPPPGGGKKPPPPPGGKR